MKTGRASPHHGKNSIGSPKLLPRWRISVIGAKIRPVGTVRAANADAAVRLAAELFGITDPRYQRRLVATRIVETGGF
jgi:hypothetical protein